MMDENGAEYDDKELAQQLAAQLRAWLSIAGPDDLISYYGLGKMVPETKKSAIVKDEAAGRQLLLQDLRKTMITLPNLSANEPAVPVGVVPGRQE